MADDLQKSNQLDAARNRGRMDTIRQKNAAGQELSMVDKLALNRRKAAEKKRSKAGKLAGKLSDPPNPPTMRTFFAFGIFAFLQDFIPLLFDLLGVGFIIGDIMLPMTWGIYIYLIVRRLPRALVPKFLLRTALISAITVIPVVGELLPEWIATAVGGYIVLTRYQAGKSGIGGKAADKAAQGVEDKVGEKVGAAG